MTAPSRFARTCAACSEASANSWGSTVSSSPSPGPSRSTLDEVLFRANESVVRYEKEFSAVVAEERYHQETLAGTRTKETRELMSDVLLVRGQGEVWSGYRDVFEVDGKPVRDRVERVQK